MSDGKLWEGVHASRNWGFYPNEGLVRYVCKTFRHKETPLTALDLGCGQGASAWFLAREGFTVVGVDQAPSALVKTNVRLANERLTFHPACGTFKHLPFRDETFDLVVDIVSVAHNTCHDIWKIYFEIERVLKPGGKFFALFPTNNCSRLPFMNYGTVSFLEQIEVERLVVNAFKGVQILKQSYELSHGCNVENWVITGARQ